MNIHNWLNDVAYDDDCLPGATFVGNGAGDGGTDWQIYDEAALAAFVTELQKGYHKSQGGDWAAVLAAQPPIDAQTFGIPELPCFVIRTTRRIVEK